MIPVQPVSANDLALDALEMLGIYGPGDNVDSADVNRVLFILNAMMDELSAKSIWVFQALPLVIPLVIDQVSYLIGPVGAQVTAPRPMQIQIGPAQASLSNVTRGANYAINDTGTVLGGTGDATYLITSVAPGGAVSGFTLTGAGTTYASNATAATAAGGAQPGIGTGLVLNITASDGPITASALVGAIIDQPIDVISDVEYSALLSYAPDPGYPASLNYKATFPSGTLSVIPAPSAFYNLFFQSWMRLIQFPDLYTRFTFAVGVIDGLRTNLALAAKTYFSDSNLDPTIPVRAGQGLDFMRYQGIGSRAMLNRFVNNSNPQKKQ